MAIGAGIGGQVGIVTEGAFNTPAAVTTFTDFMTEGFVPKVHVAEDMGITAGLLAVPGARRNMVGLDAAGPIEFYVPNKGFGRWLKAALGSSPSPVQISTSGVYTQFHNLGSADGVSWTIQKGSPRRSGTVDPLTFSGGKCVGWELSGAAGGQLKWHADWDFANVQPTGAAALGLQTASYATSDVRYGYNQIGIYSFAAYSTVSSRLTPTTPLAPAGVIRKFSLKGGQAKDTAAWTAGSLFKGEQLGNEYHLPTGTISADYDATTLQAAYLAQTPIGLQFQAIGPIIGTSGVNTAVLEFTMPTCYLVDSAAPVMNDRGVITVDYNFEVRADASAVSMQAYIQATDATLL